MSGATLLLVIAARAFGGDVNDPSRMILALPTLRIHPPVVASTVSPIGPQLSPAQLEFRMRRARELDNIFQELAWAIPAEVNALMGDPGGQVVRADLSGRSSRALTNALRRGDDVGPAIARVEPAQAVLLTWIDEVSASPMTLVSLPGEVVDTRVGPIVIDATNEPFLVHATIGAALVAPDGTTLFRTQGRYEAALRGDHALDVTALELAASVARDIAAAL